jgi:hypothetical protein
MLSGSEAKSEHTLAQYNKTKEYGGRLGWRRRGFEPASLSLPLLVVGNESEPALPVFEISPVPSSASDQYLTIETTSLEKLLHLLLS